MVASTWRGRAEWATLVAVIFVAGYISQSRDAAAEDAETVEQVIVVEEVEIDDEGAGGEIEVATETEASDQTNDNAKKVEQKEVVVRLRLDGKNVDVDVDSLPTSKAIKKIIKLSGDDNTWTWHADENNQEVAKLLAGVDAPSHYVGIHAGKVDSVLAEHLRLNEGEGVIVLLVVDDSPAAKAGVKKHDILLAGNGEKIRELKDLVDLIREGKGEEISLDLIREGEKMAITVKPEERPKKFGVGSARALFGEGPDEEKDVQVWVEKLKKAGKDGVPHALRLRSFGPEMAFGGLAGGLEKMPGNLSVRISKNDDGPAKIKVKHGEESWEFEAEDKEAMAELPDEIREFIQPMLGRIGPHGAHARAFAVEIPELHVRSSNVPKPDARIGPRDELIERLEAMEKQLKEVHEEFQKLRAEEKD